jgi:hypothetical protein
MGKFQSACTMTVLLLLCACGGDGEAEAIATVPAPIAVAPPVASPTPVPVAPPLAVVPNTMALGAATAFSQQGWNFSILDTARSMGATTLRDGVSWRDIEKAPGTYQFTSANVTYLDTLIAKGFGVTLLMSDSNPLYDNGYTVYTDAGRAAYAKYIVATLDRFPGIKAIEIGNEYNAFNFVTGPVLSEGYGPRQKYYFDMLRTVYTAVKASHPTVKILGGAAIDIPVGYFKPLFELGALSYMDGLTIHPYDTDPEQLEKQLAILRSAMGANARPIYITEFAKEMDSIPDTASYLVKAVAVMATSGVAEADWYALRQQGSASDIWYKNVALSSFSGEMLAPGQAYQVMSQQVLAKGAGTRIAIDDFTYAYEFGRNAMVIWGEPRSLTVTASAKFYNSQGAQIAQPTAITAGSPIIIISDTPLVYGGNVTLGATQLVADSYDQFDFSYDVSGPATYEGPWAYYAYGTRRQTFDVLYTQGGGEISSSDWMPYIGSNSLRPLNINANNLNPVDFGTASSPDIFKPVLRYTSPHSGNFTVKGSWDVTSRSSDGIDITVQVNAKTVFSTAFNGHYDMEVKGLSLSRGDVVNIIVGTNKNVTGSDNTRYRIKIYRNS